MVAKITTVQTRSQALRQTQRVIDACFQQESITSLILRKLPGGQVAQARLINRGVKSFIDTNPALQQKIALTQTLSEIIFREEICSETKRKATGAIAELDLPFALAHARSFASTFCRTKHLIEVAEQLTGKDSEEAKAVYQEAIAAAKERREGFRHSTRTVVSNLLYVATSVVNHDKQIAKEICDELIDMMKQDDEEARLRIQQRRRELRPEVRLFEPAPIFPMNIGRITEIYAKIDLDKAFVLIEEVPELLSVNEVVRSEALLTLAGEIAQTDAARALQIAHTLEDLEDRINALKRIVTATTSRDPRFALETFREAVKVLDEPAMISSDFALKEKEKTAQSLAKIAGALIAHDPQEAKELFDEAISLTSLFDLNVWKAAALAQVALELVKLDAVAANQYFTEALQIARQEEDVVNQVYGLRKVAVELRKSDEETAREILWEAYALAKQINRMVDYVEEIVPICQELSTMFKEHELLRV